MTMTSDARILANLRAYLGDASRGDCGNSRTVPIAAILAILSDRNFGHEHAVTVHVDNFDYRAEHEGTEYT